MSFTTRAPLGFDSKQPDASWSDTRCSLVAAFSDERLNLRRLPRQRLTYMATLLVLGTIGIATGLSGTAHGAEPQPIKLWEQGAPGSEARMQEPEKVDLGPGKCNVTNVHQPSITPYFPAADKATGAAIVIAPGGGHRMLCLGHEGDSLAKWFADEGIAAFVLRYRLAREEGSTYTVDEHAMADTRRAIRMVRAAAADWKIEAERIGILGFSAGGELAALSAMQSDAGDQTALDPIDRVSCRPDFQVLIYPGSSSRFTVTKGMPPAFIALGAKDRPDISLGMAELYLKYKAADVPCELHIYSNAGHGFGYRPESTSAAGDWPIRLREWMLDSKFIAK